MTIINQSHSGTGDNVAGNKIIIGSQQRVLNNQSKEYLLSNLNKLLLEKDRKIIMALAAPGSDSECLIFLDEIKRFLLDSGIKVEEGIAELHFNNPIPETGIMPFPPNSDDLAVFVGPKK